MTQTEQIMVELKTYRDCSIQVDQNGYFITIIGGETINATTLRSLEEKMDDFLRAEAKQLTVDLAVLDGEGNACRIIGINLGSGKVITRPSGNKGPFVVNVRENAALVTTYNKNKAVQVQLHRQLGELGVPDSFGYGRITSDEYPVKMRELQQSYDNAVERSNENAE